MQMTIVKKGVRAITLLSVFLSLQSCMDEAYDLDKLNTEVTIGQSGLYLPLGNTAKLKIKDLMEELDEDILIETDGVFALNISDTLDLSENLPDMNEMLKVADINFNDSFIYEIDDLSAEGMVIDQISVSTKVDAGKELETDVTVPEISDNRDIALGLNDYAQKLRDIDLGKSLKEEILQTKATFPLPQGNQQISSLKTPIAPYSSEYKVSMESPDSKISNIRDVKLDKNAKINIKMELTGHEFLKSGDIVPNIRLEYGNLLGISKPSGEQMGSQVTLTKPLNKANNFTTTEQYTVNSLNINSSDWKGGTLNISAPMNINGEVTIKNASLNQSTTGNKEIRIKITITFEGMNVKSATFDLSPVEIKESMDIPVSLGNGISLPEQISSIENVTFTPSSNISMALTPKNLNIPNLNARANSMSVKFPSAMKLSGSTDGSFQLGGFDLKRGMNKSFNVESIDFNMPQTGGILKWDDVVKVQTNIVFSGTGINSANISNDPAKDGAVNAKAEANLQIRNWKATTKAFEHAIDPIEQTFTQNLFGKISEFGTFIVTPSGNPQIIIDLRNPASSLPLKGGASGIRIQFPEFIKFKNVDPSYNFDQASNSITFRGVVPQRITMNIDRLIITPEPREGGVGHELTGKFTVSGSAAFDKGNITSDDIDNLVRDGFSINAQIPRMTPESVELNEFKIDVDQTITTTLLKGSEIPDELNSLEEATLFNVKALFGMSFTNLPNIGVGKTMTADFALTLPKEIVLDESDNRVKGNTLHIKGNIKNQKLDVEPVRIKAINLSDYDLTKKEDITGEIKVLGKLNVENPNIDISSPLKPVTAKVAADVANIRFEKIRGKVDYTLDPVIEEFALTDVPDFLKGEDVCLDIDNPYLLIKAKTNIGIPVKGKLTVVPVRNGVEDTEETITVDVTLKGSASASEKDSTLYFIAAKSDGCPADYQFVECEHIKSIIKTIPDKLNLTFNARSESSEESVVEPQETYSLDVTYSLVAPLAFGNELKIEMKDTLAIEDETFTQIIKGNKLQLGGTITNALPLQLDLNVDLIDKDDNITPPSEPAVQTLKACASDGSAYITPLNLTLFISKETDLSNFKGLVFTFKVTSGNVTGLPVTENSFVQGVISARLPEGATVNLEDFNKNQDE